MSELYVGVALAFGFIALLALVSNFEFRVIRRQIEALESLDAEEKCPHLKRWEFYPCHKHNDVYHVDGEVGRAVEGSRVTHGMKFHCCHECGKVWFEDYAQ